jgi:hypothetical protein
MSGVMLGQSCRHVDARVPIKLFTERLADMLGGMERANYAARQRDYDARQLDRFRQGMACCRFGATSAS